MKIKVYETSVKLWLSASDTENWATRPGAGWPCSQTRGHRLFAEFDRNGLCDLALNGEPADIDAHEFNAITSDHLRRSRIFRRAHGWKAGPGHHPCWFVACGQFQTA